MLKFVTSIDASSLTRFASVVKWAGCGSERLEWWSFFFWLVAYLAFVVLASLSTAAAYPPELYLWLGLTAVAVFWLLKGLSPLHAWGRMIGAVVRVFATLMPLALATLIAVRYRSGTLDAATCVGALSTLFFWSALYFASLRMPPQPREEASPTRFGEGSLL